MARAREVLIFVGLIGALGAVGHLVARRTGAPPAQPLAVGPSAWSIPPDDPRLGERAYAQCRGCHQPDGAGIPGTYPPLAGNPRVLGESTALIRIALQGFDSRQPDGPALWPLAMPGLGARMADHELAGALSFIRGQWGNAQPPITAAEVARVRARTALRQRPWTPTELAAPRPP